MFWTNYRKSLIASIIIFALTLACGGPDGSPNGSGETPPPPPVEPPPPPPPPPPVIPSPVVTAVSPNTGTYLGGQQVSLSGENFEAGITVVFGTVAVHVVSATATEVTVITPAHAVGVVDVFVTNTNGKSATLSRGFAFTKSPQERAREIMGSNYFGVEENERHFGIVLSDADAEKFESVYFSEEALVKMKDTHILVLVLPGPSIVDIGAMLPAGGVAYCNAWVASQPFAADAGGNGRWVLMKKSLLANSLNLLESEQVKLFATGSEYMPSVRELVYILAGYYLKTNEVLLTGVFGRTRSFTNADTLYVGANAFGGMFGICSGPGETRDPAIGMSVEWLSRYTY